jgi:thiol-disulfide isomerase/thioredoxin
VTLSASAPPSSACLNRSRRRGAARALVAVAAGLLLPIAGRPAHAAAAPAVPGALAPDVAMQSDSGPLALLDHRGKLVYLDFWASWCGPCRQSFPWMTEMQARYGRRGLQVIAVSVDARPDDARRFHAANPAGFAVAFDPAGESARRFAIRAMPTSVLIGPDGRVIATHSGFRAADREPLESAIRDALARL